MPTHPPRPRNAALTRDAILHSAIRHFARSGYDGVGVREIAADAGVTAMLVNRYFGSKEQLFAEAVETSFARPVFIGEVSDEIGRDAATALAAHSAPRADSVEPFLIMVRSVSNPTAVRIVRAAIERHVGRRLARQLPGPDNQLRSEMMLSVIAGVLLMRRVIGTRALSKVGNDKLADVLEAIFAPIID
jgi:AcrR family transcriptional regulator